MKLLYYLCIQHIQLVINWQNSSPLTAIKTLKQMPYQWLYNPIIKITASYGMLLGNIIKTLKISPTIIVSVCYYIYKLVEQSNSHLGRFLECWKCNILVITQVLVLCLIYTHLPSGIAYPQGLHVYIRQSTLACVINLYI